MPTAIASRLSTSLNSVCLSSDFAVLADDCNEGVAMALFAKFWDRIAPLSKDVGPSKDVRADAARSAQMDDYIADKVSPRGPGFSLAIIKSGATVHAAGYGLAD